MPVYISIFTPDGTEAADFASGLNFECIELSRIREVLDNSVEAKVVLVAHAPQELLSRRLRSESDPGRALDVACGEVASALKPFRQARRSILLLDFAECQRSPDQFRKAVAGWEQGKLPEPVEPQPVSSRQVGAAAAVIARALIKSDRLADQLAQEFDASCYSLEVNSASDASLARRAALELGDFQSGKPLGGGQCLSENVPEKQSPSSLASDLSQLREINANLQAGLDECARELSMAYRQSDNGSEPGTMGAERMDQMALARDVMKADLKALEVEVSHLRRDNQMLHETLKEIRSSTSWKLTAPLRRLRGAPREEGEGRTGE